jgi:hypothetical protein
MTDEPAHITELVEFLEVRLDDPVAVLAAVLALLADSRAYTERKTQPAGPLVDLAHELTLRDPALRSFLSDAFCD